MTHPDKPLSEFTNYPPLTQSQQDILREIGLALFTVQGIEHILKFLLDFTFPDNPNASLRDLLDGSNEQKKKTLGGFIHELRKRAHVEPEFEAMLLKFLTFRNRFIHTLFHEKGFGLGTDEEIQAVSRFLDSFSYERWMIQSTLMGYVKLWTESIGIRDAGFESSVYGKNLHKYFMPALNPKKMKDN